MTSQDSSNGHSLFLDTSYGITLGLLDRDYRWLEFEVLEGQKSSEIIHDKINIFLEKHQVDIQSIDIFVLSGPGSYTGLRVSQGIAQIFELNGAKVYSFDIFKVGIILSEHIEAGMKWIFPAFKSELYIRDVTQDEGELVDESAELLDKYITHGSNKFDALSKLNSRQLIKDYAPRVFSEVKNRSLRDEIFYFRTLDKEFSK